MKLLASFIASTLAQGLTDERNFDYGSFADYGLGVSILSGIFLTPTLVACLLEYYKPENRFFGKYYR